MNGKIGSLHVGRLQIGGFLNWTLDVNLTGAPKEDATYYKLAKWRLTAESYWLYDIPDRVLVRLYAGKGYWEGKGKVTSNPRKLFDTLVHEPIEIIGEGVLEGKE